MNKRIANSRPFHWVMVLGFYGAQSLRLTVAIMLLLLLLFSMASSYIESQFIMGITFFVFKIALGLRIPLLFMPAARADIVRVMGWDKACEG
ncbi:hypothetical protein [Vibrio sp. D431a]|uniref:hypothetical protein n=1 Tax=Vibrio sp. D431a TaxID=2837388 RepID=UPI00255715DA|nr:hypothetical protein [Vibrio sp. D431a]MDK9789882.1 hypothetical protein [Vibrio sp. D431a]